MNTTNEFGWASTRSGQEAEFGHRRSVASDDDAFALLDAAQDFASRCSGDRAPIVLTASTA